MSEEQIYEVLKNISLLDAFSIIAKRNNVISNLDEIDKYYTAKDLYQLYPNVFSKYKLEKYIKEENLPVMKQGKERLFLKTNVEKWLKSKSELQFNKVRKPL